MSTRPPLIAASAISAAILILMATPLLLAPAAPAAAASASIRAGGYERPERTPAETGGSANGTPAADPGKGSTNTAGTAAASAAAGTAAKHGAAATGAGAVVQVRRGDTLDKLVNAHLGKLPLRPDLLRQAVIQKNPGLFKDGKARPLVVGAQIVLPGIEELRRLLPPELSGLDGGAPEPVAANDPIDPRKGWVRYP